MSAKTTPDKPAPPAPQPSAEAAYLDLWEANIALFARADAPRAGTSTK